MTNVICRPLVSVIVHNFNYGKYLEECLTSVMAQTYENIEVLFSDNASTDNSWEIAQKFDKKYPNKFSLTKTEEIWEDIPILKSGSPSLRENIG